MGDAKRRRARAQQDGGGSTPGVSFDEALDLTERDGISFWAWQPRSNGFRTIGADVYITYKDDGEQGDGKAWVWAEGDDWDSPDGEGDSVPMNELGPLERRLQWHRTEKDWHSLEELSFLKLRELGCTDPAVLAISRRFDQAQ
jgi:hypothetical protein